MQINEEFIKGVYTIDPHIHSDFRGSFFRSFCIEEFRSAGIKIDQVVQTNRSFNKRKGTFRGLHFQLTPFAEDKIISCLRGHVMDIIVDLRKGSKTLFSSLQVELSESNFKSIVIPKGCAHGFLTMTPDSELLYMHTNYYNPKYESAVSILDPKFDIKLPEQVVVFSERDEEHPLLDQNFLGFNYEL